MKRRKAYTEAYKREAVELTEQAGVSIKQIAKELDIEAYNLYRWRKLAKDEGELAFSGNGKVALSEEQRENQALKRELERVKQERDILKKAVGFFAKEST